MKNEEWKIFVGDYFVNNFGQIRRKNRLLKLIKTNKGYLQVNISLNGKVKCYFVHRIVATCFVRNPKNKSCVNHIDNNPLNNQYWNLEWCTHQENRAHCVNQNRQRGQHRGELNTNAKLTDKKVREIRARYKMGFRQKYIAMIYRVDQSLISLIVRKKIW